MPRNRRLTVSEKNFIDGDDMNAGIYFIGVLKGYFENQNGQYVNRELAVVTGDYTNRFNETVENIETVAIGNNIAQQVAQKIADMKGKPVKIRVAYNLRKGTNNKGPWAFVSFFLRTADDIELLDQVPLKKVASGG